MGADTRNMRMLLQHVSQCCGKPMYIGRYSAGGFVKACCEGCGRQTTLSQYDFEKASPEFELSCKTCGQTMQPTTNADGYNYGFRCECGTWMLLADIVPDLPR